MSVTSQRVHATRGTSAWLAVCVAFNATDRLGDAFGFEVLSPEGFEAGTRYLLKRGYR